MPHGILTEQNALKKSSPGNSPGRFFMDFRWVCWYSSTPCHLAVLHHVRHFWSNPVSTSRNQDTDCVHGSLHGFIFQTGTFVDVVYFHISLDTAIEIESLV